MEESELEMALALAMYREALNDVNADLDCSIPGVEINTNTGELDFQAEILIRNIWSKVDKERQQELLKKAAKMSQDRSSKQEKARRKIVRSGERVKD